MVCSVNFRKEEETHWVTTIFLKKKSVEEKNGKMLDRLVGGVRLSPIHLNVYPPLTI